MRVTLVAILIIFMAACSSAPVYMGIDKNAPISEVSILDGKCDKACEDIIMTKFREKFDDKGINISQLILVSVDGKFGPYKYVDRRGSYNNAWDTGLALITLNPGEHKFQTMPNHHLSTRYVQSDFSIQLDKGHQYFFGGVIVNDGKFFGGNPSFEWSPIVFDKTNKKIVYPMSEIKTKHQKVRIIFIPI